MSRLQGRKLIVSKARRLIEQGKVQEIPIQNK